MKIRRQGHWERGQRRSRPKRLGTLAMVCRCIIFASPVFTARRNQLVIKSRHGAAHEQSWQVFSRIHVEDIAMILLASMAKPQAGRAYSVCDDEPAPPQDVVTFAATLMGLEPPPLIAFEDADLSPMAKSFYGENKRIKNTRIKQELGVTLKYPSYREGLRALFEAQDF